MVMCYTVAQCCTGKLGNECGVLLRTAVQGIREYLRWLYGQRTCLVCVPRMIRLQLELGDKRLLIGVKRPQSGSIVRSNSVRLVAGAAALRESRVPPEKEVQPISPRTRHAIPRYIPVVVVQLRHRLSELQLTNTKVSMSRPNQGVF